ncbi:MAG: hypothetical protein IPK50_16960 [Fibrobacterota bacterium]|nr:hypothetical protein [Fibrobacterota bacterium]QQS03971.1 MAG: hypothetical protein IPK50_16960 [Fibrobacterota bacterium]
MSMFGRKPRVELGEAVTFESVLTILTVLLVLRVVFLVPMVNLEKAKTVEAKKDGIWDKTAARAIGVPEVNPYGTAFGLSKARMTVSVTTAEDSAWIEAAMPDSSVVVVVHAKKLGRYVRLHAQSRSETPSCQYGQIGWSPDEKQWFTWSDSVDYGDKGVMDGAMAGYRQWISRVSP